MLSGFQEALAAHAMGRKRFDGGDFRRESTEKAAELSKVAGPVPRWGDLTYLRTVRLGIDCQRRRAASQVHRIVKALERHASS